MEELNDDEMNERQLTYESNRHTEKEKSFYGFGKRWKVNWKFKYFMSEWMKFFYVDFEKKIVSTHKIF